MHHLERFSTYENVFSFAEKAAFSVYARPLGEEKLLLAKKVGVFSSCKTTNKEKLFLSAAKLQFSTTPKLTEVNKFHPRNPTVSLQYNIPFSKVSNLASALRLSFRTDSNPHRRYPVSLRFPASPVT